MRHERIRLTMLGVLGFAIVCTCPSASAITLEDFPEDARPDWYDSIDPNNIALAYYDYTQTEGLEGQYTDLLEGPESLFDETRSGISDMEGDWNWVSGTGWTLSGSFVVYHWGNVRLLDWEKRFAQSVRISNGIPDTNKITAWTDSGDDEVTITHAGYSLITGNLVIHITVHPQPNDVWVKVPISATSTAVIDQGWVLDQCIQYIPEPATVALMIPGLFLLRKRPR